MYFSFRNLCISSRTHLFNHILNKSNLLLNSNLDSCESHLVKFRFLSCECSLYADQHLASVSRRTSPTEKQESSPSDRNSRKVQSVQKRRPLLNPMRSVEMPKPQFRVICSHLTHGVWLLLRRQISPQSCRPDPHSAQN